MYPTDGKNILTGDYRHELIELPDTDCGHAMIFKDFEGNCRICYHDHNSDSGKERARIHYIDLDDCNVKVADKKSKLLSVH